MSALAGTTPTAESSLEATAVSTLPIRLPNLDAHGLTDQSSDLSRPDSGIGSFSLLSRFTQNNMGLSTLKEIPINEELPAGSKLYSAHLDIHGSSLPIEILDLPNGQRRIRVGDKLRLNGINLLLENGAFKSLAITTGPLAGTEFKRSETNAITATHWKATLGTHTIDLDPVKNEMTLTLGEGPFAGAQCKWDSEHNRFTGLTMRSDLGMCTLNLNFGASSQGGVKQSREGGSTKESTPNKIGAANPEVTLTINEGNLAGTTLQYDRTKERFSGRFSTSLADSVNLICTIPKKPSDPLAFSGTIGQGDSMVEFATSGGKSNTLSVGLPIGQLGRLSLETNPDQRIGQLQAVFPGMTIEYSDGSSGFGVMESSTNTAKDKEGGDSNSFHSESALTRRSGLDRFPSSQGAMPDGFNLSFNQLDRELVITNARFDRSGRFTGGRAAFRFGNSEQAVTGDIDADLDGVISVAIKAPLLIDGTPAEVKLKYFSNDELGGIWEGEFTRGDQTFKLQYHDGEWRLFGKQDRQYAFLTGLNRNGHPFFAGGYTAGSNLTFSIALTRGSQPKASFSWERRF